MSKRGGFQGGMPGNMNNLMKQAQRMQRQMEQTTADLETKEVTAAAGGGATTASDQRLRLGLLAPRCRCERSGRGGCARAGGCGRADPGLG